MGLLDPAVFEQLNKLKGLLGETPIGRYVRGQDQGVSMNGLLGAMRAMPVFDQQASMGDMQYAADAMGPGAIAGVTKLAKGMTKFEKAHKLAQKNAALPIEQGGLGLPKNNTAADRAKALGFDADAYHGTIADPDQLIPRDSGAVFAATGDTKTAREIASKYAGGDWTTPIARDSLAISGANESPQIMPLMLRGADRTYIEAMVRDPRNIRSRFAAFDPKRKDEADLLAAYFGFPIQQERE